MPKLLLWFRQRGSRFLEATEARCFRVGMIFPTFFFRNRPKMTEVCPLGVRLFVKRTNPPSTANWKAPGFFVRHGTPWDPVLSLTTQFKFIQTIFLQALETNIYMYLYNNNYMYIYIKLIIYIIEHIIIHIIIIYIWLRLQIVPLKTCVNKLLNPIKIDWWNHHLHWWHHLVAGFHPKKNLSRKPMGFSRNMGWNPWFSR